MTRQVIYPKVQFPLHFLSGNSHGLENDKHSFARSSLANAGDHAGTAQL